MIEVEIVIIVIITSMKLGCQPKRARKRKSRKSRKRKLRKLRKLKIRRLRIRIGNPKQAANLIAPPSVLQVTMIGIITRMIVMSMTDTTITIEIRAVTGRVTGAVTTMIVTGVGAVTTMTAKEVDMITGDMRVTGLVGCTMTAGVVIEKIVVTGMIIAIGEVMVDIVLSTEIVTEAVTGDPKCLLINHFNFLVEQ